MNLQHPLGAKRLYALIGDKIHDFPLYFIERLERKLEQHEQQQSCMASSSRLQRVPDAPAAIRAPTADRAAQLKDGGNVAVRLSTLQGLDAILEILHSAHVARQEGEPSGVIGEHLVEGLILAARSLARDTTGAVWGDP